MMPTASGEPDDGPLLIVNDWITILVDTRDCTFGTAANDAVLVDGKRVTRAVSG